MHAQSLLAKTLFWLRERTDLPCCSAYCRRRCRFPFHPFLKSHLVSAITSNFKHVTLLVKWRLTVCSPAKQRLSNHSLALQVLLNLNVFWGALMSSIFKFVIVLNVTVSSESERNNMEVQHTVNPVWMLISNQWVAEWGDQLANHCTTKQLENVHSF